MTPEAIIQHCLTRLREAYSFSPTLGAELELYVVLGDTMPATMDGFWRPIKEAHPSLLRIEKERGDHQYELVFAHTSSAEALCVAVETVRVAVAQRAASLGVEASFAPRPFAGQPPSGLHLHLGLCNAEGESVFLKNDEYISPALHHALGGLCALSPHVMPLLCPTPEGFFRFEGADHIARNVSWGSNNRSCAIRIPYSPIMDDKRIEWRLPGADASVTQAMALMFMGVLAGLDHRMEPPPQYHGVASRDASLPLLPLTPEAAWDAMQALPSLFSPLTPEILSRWSGRAG